MPDPATDRQAGIEITLLLLECEPYPHQRIITPSILADFVTAVETVTQILHFIARQQDAEPVMVRAVNPDEVDELMTVIHTVSPYFVSLDMHSPLDMVLAVPGLAKAAAQAIVEFLKGLMFYQEERLYRSAEAAEKWEDVYAKRLENIRTAIAIAQSVDRGGNDVKPVSADYVEQLLEATHKLERAQLKLNRIDTTEVEDR